MRSWFLRPMVHIHTLNERLDSVDVMVQCPDVCQQMQEQLKQVCACGAQAWAHVHTTGTLPTPAPYPSEQLRDALWTWHGHLH